MIDNRIYVFDTTLRDGEQSAGVAFNVREKLEIAKQLERLGVDILEAGFPCTSPGDLKAVKLISQEVRGLTVCALARAVKEDIDAAWEAIREAADPRIHVFINTSDLQIENQLKMSREQVFDQAISMVKYAASLTSNVEFSPMDATRTDKDFLYNIIEHSIKAGATTINVPDSVGVALPDEHGNMFADIIANIPGIDKVVLSCHAHNDLGLSTANSLAAIQNGVRQVEVAINGIGERAGNTSLEEVVMALKVRKDFMGFDTNIKTTEIYHTSKLIERLSGMKVQWNKAIVGRNSFRHGSGIHQDGILKKRETWEILDPAEIGVPEGTQLILGKLSGRHAFRAKIEELGYDLNDKDMNNAFVAFKNLADKKRELDDRDLEEVVAEQLGEVEGSVWQLKNIQVTAGNKITSTATIRLIDPQGNELLDAATGTGPLDAMYRAMNRITGLSPRFSELTIHSVTEGIDAQGSVTVRLENLDRTYTGHASDTDIIVASARAYTNAINRMITSKIFINNSKL